MAVMRPTQLAVIEKGVFDRPTRSRTWSPAEASAKTMTFAAAGDAVLVVPEADERSGAVAVHADRMRVHRAGDALRLHARQHGSENLVAGAARADFFHGNVLHCVRVGECSREPRGGFALA